MASTIIRRWSISLTLSLLVLAAIGFSLSRSTIVNASGGNPYPGGFPCNTTLQACIDGLSDGDEIDIAGGTYTESFTLNKAISLVGDDSSTTFLVAAANDRVLTVTGSSITSSVVISGLTFMGGNLSVGNGGGLLITATYPVALRNVVITGNTAQRGGGLYLANSHVVAAGSTIAGNTADFGAGVYQENGEFDLVSGAIEENNANFTGGGVYLWQATAEFTQTGGSITTNTASYGAGVGINQGRFNLINGHIDQNDAASEGGAVFMNDPIGVFNQSGGTLGWNSAAYGGGAKVINGTYNLSGGEIVGNQASSKGGGIYVYQVDAVFNQTNGSLEQNSAYRGGGVYLDSGTAALNRGLILSNTATDRGGGVYANGAITIGQIWLANNTAADDGGGVFAANGLVISGTTFSDNTTFSGDGGGVLADVLLATNSSFTHNRSMTGYGGGVYAFYLILDNVTFDTNRANAKGGGAYSVIRTRVTGSTFSNNVSQDIGGGLSAKDDVFVTATQFISNFSRYGGGLGLDSSSTKNRIINSIFARNTASSKGAGLYLDTNGKVELLQLTLANPAPGSYGSAIYVHSGVVTLTNSIIASSTIGIHRTGGTFKSDYNLFYGNGVNASGVISIGSHSIIGFPDFNNQTADDFHINADSAALNMAKDIGVKWDIDNDRRPLGGGFDIGADESRAARVVADPTVTSTLSFTTTDGTNIQLVIPPGAVTTTTPIYYSIVPSVSVAPPPTSNLLFAGSVFELDGFQNGSDLPGLSFSVPVVLTFHYSITDVKGIYEQSLKLYRFELTLGAWKPIGYQPGESQVLDVNAKTLTAVLNHFTRFGRMGPSMENDIFLPIVVKSN